MSAYYRFYCVSPTGRFIDFEESHCETDEDAQVHARSQLADKVHCEAVEVWNLGRKVGQVRREDA